MTVSGILMDFGERYGDAEARKYLHTHSHRYETLLRFVADAIVGSSSDPVRVLDVGPAYEVEAIRVLHPSAVIDTIGWHDPRFPARAGERHAELDFNDSDDSGNWPSLEPYDVVVCAEVIEHLYTSPLHLLRLIASLLRPEGRVVLQTPNAAALARRFHLLLGRNPFEPIRENRRHPGHFREYTLDELRRLAGRAGLEVVEVRLENYFLSGSRKNRVLVVAASPLFPPRLRQGITMKLRKAKR